MFPDRDWFKENEPAYNHPWFTHYYDRFHFGVSDDEEIFEILGLDPDTVSVSLDSANVYGEHFPILVVKGKDNADKDVLYYGQFAGVHNGRPLIGYTFYTEYRGLTWNLSGIDKLKAMQILADYYGLGGGTSFTKLAGRPVPLRPFTLRAALPAARPGWIGRIGELYAGATTPKTRIFINGRGRITDILNATTLGEVKKR